MSANANEVKTSTSPLFVNVRKIGRSEESRERSEDHSDSRRNYSYEEWQTICAEIAAASGYDPQRLASLCAISLRQLERQFKAELRCTPREWLNEQRMVTAGRLLAKSGSIKEVAYSLAYKQPSHFTREFKGHFGVTPTQYRDLQDTWRARRTASGTIANHETVRAHS